MNDELVNAVELTDESLDAVNGGYDDGPINKICPKCGESVVHIGPIPYGKEGPGFRYTCVLCDYVEY